MRDSMYIDKEYAMLEMLSENEELSQRQLSRRLDISLGSVNMLINKMQREGLIKFKNISANSIAYMLTPEGIAEKANKTYKYITYHYKRINDTKEKIKGYLDKKMEIENKIYLILDNSELSEMVSFAVSEMENLDNEKIKILNERQVQEVNNDGLVVLVKNEGLEKFETYRVELLLEKL